VRLVPDRTRERRVLVVTAAVLVLVVLAGGVLMLGHLRRGGEGTDAAGPRGRTATPTPTLAEPGPVLAADTPGGAAPKGVQAAMAGVLGDPRLGGRVSARVVDVASGEVLLDRNGTHLATPASTTKITTAVAALAVLPPDHRFTTRVVQGPNPGEVVLVGGGDPTLSAAPAGRPAWYAGAPRLSDLAAQLHRSGQKVSRVLVDASLFADSGLNRTWDPTDVDGGYITPVRALMADGGRSQQAGTRARSHQPDLDAGRALAAMLGVPASAVTAGRAPAGAKVLAEVTSPPLVRLVEEMLAASDNVVAEVLARQVAVARGRPATFEGAAGAVRDVLQGLGVDTTTEKLVDGSGLSPQDRLSPGLLVDVLHTAASPQHPELHALFSGLPVAGYDGTLASRYRSGPEASSAGVVRAKTGTLTGVSSLAGVVEDAEGRLLAFAFMADQVPPGGTLSAESALDAAAAKLASCGCS
jgi:serine-type D-Ala-D-Ala carboxypeptidase/endopeptidase (penicillin-binding protein 4)